MIFLDEVTFTKQAIQKKDWSAKYTNLQVNEADVYIPYVSVIAAVSAYEGLELIMMNEEAIDSSDFQIFVKKLSRKNSSQPFGLFMDNLRVHKTKDAMEKMEKLNITPLWNIPYCPDTNPIESCFSIVKQRYKKDRLHHLINKKEFDTKKGIERAFL